MDDVTENTTTSLSDAFEEEIPEGATGLMCCLDHTGDTRLVWDYKDDDSVEVAKEMFNKLKKKGHIAYAVKKDGTAGEVITEFDPKAEKIIMSPPMVGG